MEDAANATNFSSVASIVGAIGQMGGLGGVVAYFIWRDNKNQATADKTDEAKETAWLTREQRLIDRLERIDDYQKEQLTKLATDSHVLTRETNAVMMEAASVMKEFSGAVQSLECIAERRRTP